MMLSLILILASTISASAYYQIRTLGPDELNRPVMMFDLDNTLYRRDSVELNSRALGIQFLQEKRGLASLEAERLMNLYRERYNGIPTLGLVKELGLDGAEYEKYIFERSNLDRQLRPDPRLDALLKSMQARLYVLTNAGLDHAMTALKSIGILDRFNGIIYVDYGKSLILPKPEPQIYLEAMKFVQVSDPAKIYFLDDQLTYARTAKALGWNAVVLDTDLKSRTCPDPSLPCIRSIYELPRAIPTLFI